MSKLKPTDKQKEALGDALRHARDSVGLTQEELAELLDCSSRWVQKLEGRKSNPNWFTLFAALRAAEYRRACTAGKAGPQVAGRCPVISPHAAQIGRLF